MAVDKLTLSGSTNGRGIEIPNFGGLHTIHTGPSVSTSYDEVWLYLMAGLSFDFLITVNFYWGGETSPDDLIQYQVVAGNYGLHLIAPGLILRGNATPLVIKARTDVDLEGFGAVVFGYVNRIS